MTPYIGDCVTAFHNSGTFTRGENGHKDLKVAEAITLEKCRSGSLGRWYFVRTVHAVSLERNSIVVLFFCVSGRSSIRKMLMYMCMCLSEFASAMLWPTEGAGHHLHTLPIFLWFSVSCWHLGLARKDPNPTAGPQRCGVHGPASQWWSRVTVVASGSTGKMEGSNLDFPRIALWDKIEYARCFISIKFSWTEAEVIVFILFMFMKKLEQIWGHLADWESKEDSATLLSQTYIAIFSLGGVMVRYKTESWWHGLTATPIELESIRIPGVQSWFSRFSVEQSGESLTSSACPTFLIF